ncbi:MAG: tail fiber protein [Burkholderiaceae bacterium]|nr:tail fiber protein [Burkholderiaceae bacterium]
MSDCFIGEIRLWSGVRIPANWALCNGQAMPINQYEALFALIGTTYGGTGTTDFQLPDLRGMLPIGQGGGPGLTPRVLGQTLGAATVTLDASATPAHSHVMQASTAAASTGTPAASLVLAAPETNLYNNGSVTTSVIALNDAAITPWGPAAAAPHNNMMPSTSLNYIIALNGMYPVQP